MGLSQSSRKLTIENDENDSNVIRISDRIATRLSQSAAAAHHKAEVAPPPTVTRPVKATALPQEFSDAYYPHLTISALEMQQQKERELADQDSYWQRRLQNLEKSHEKINRTIEEEYKKALSIFDDCRVIKIQNAIKPCIESRQRVLQCYQDNPRETLRCADLVGQFSDCVDQRRMQLIKCN